MHVLPCLCKMVLVLRRLTTLTLTVRSIISRFISWVSFNELCKYYYSPPFFFIFLSSLYSDHFNCKKKTFFFSFFINSFCWKKKAREEEWRREDDNTERSLISPSPLPFFTFPQTFYHPFMPFSHCSVFFFCLHLLFTNMYSARS